MKGVFLRVGDDGEIWVTYACRGWVHVHDGRAVQAILAPVVCAQCGREMDIRGAIIDGGSGHPTHPTGTERSRDCPASLPFLRRTLEITTLRANYAEPLARGRFIVHHPPDVLTALCT